MPEADIFRQTQSITHKQGADSQESLRQAQVQAHTTDRKGDERHRRVENSHLAHSGLHDTKRNCSLSTTPTQLLVTGWVLVINVFKMMTYFDSMHTMSSSNVKSDFRKSYITK